MTTVEELAELDLSLVTYTIDRRLKNWLISYFNSEEKPSLQQVEAQLLDLKLALKQYLGPLCGCKLEDWQLLEGHLDDVFQPLQYDDVENTRKVGIFVPIKVSTRVVVISEKSQAVPNGDQVLFANYQKASIISPSPTLWLCTYVRNSVIFKY